MFHKEDVRFPAEGSIELSAWLFVPERRATRLPAITMAWLRRHRISWPRTDGRSLCRGGVRGSGA
jgi:hypothetical protein